MKTKLQKNIKGFTIIEVLIVLAIAGLIILIVFLAVPALQRNSRNTQRSDDVARALGAAQEVLNNNNGDLGLLSNDNLRDAIGTPAYYDIGQISVGGDADDTTGNDATEDSAILYHGATCGADGVVVNGSTRQLAMAFRVEPDVPRCQSS